MSAVDEAGHERTAVVLLGSNIQPEVFLPRAVAGLRAALGPLRVSAAFASDAAGGCGPSFLNAAVAFETPMPAMELKRDVLRPLEADLGRVRTADRNAPRTIDLDLVLLGDEIADGDVHGVTLPDPDLLLHAHVAVPVAELVGEWPHPVTGERLRDVARRVALGASSLRRHRCLDEDRSS